MKPGLIGSSGPLTTIGTAGAELQELARSRLLHSCLRAQDRSGPRTEIPVCAAGEDVLQGPAWYSLERVPCVVDSTPRLHHAHCSVMVVEQDREE